MILTVSIAVITVFLFVCAVLFAPEIALGHTGKTIKCYPFIPLIGGCIMVILRCIPLSDCIRVFTEASAVNPLRILILFLSMTIFSLILEQTGFFEWISGVVLKRSGKRQIRVFLSLYLLISLLTVFTSNDIVILTFTPFICHFCRSGKVDPIPYLIMEFVAANTWSLFLLIGNPTNIYLSGAFAIDFSTYLRTMALPTAVAGLTSLLIMYLLFRKQLKGEISSNPPECQIKDKSLMAVALSHLILCVILLSLSSYLHWEMWLIALGTALSSVIFSVICRLAERKPLTPVRVAVSHMPFSVVPFVLGMFLVVLGLDTCGFTADVARLLSDYQNAFSFGFLSMLMSNVLNNIPMSVLFSRILAFGTNTVSIYATVLGSNIGAFLTPVGALAGIMWFQLLHRNRVSLKVPQFIGYGLLIGLPTALLSLLALAIVF